MVLDSLSLGLIVLDTTLNVWIFILLKQEKKRSLEAHRSASPKRPERKEPSSSESTSWTPLSDLPLNPKRKVVKTAEDHAIDKDFIRTRGRGPGREQ